eukprot:751172-Hanusia_phi.AAC.12
MKGGGEGEEMEEWRVEGVERVERGARAEGRKEGGVNPLAGEQRETWLRCCKRSRQTSNHRLCATSTASPTSSSSQPVAGSLLPLSSTTPDVITQREADGQGGGLVPERARSEDSLPLTSSFTPLLHKSTRYCELERASPASSLPSASGPPCLGPSPLLPLILSSQRQ